MQSDCPESEKIPMSPDPAPRVVAIVQARMSSSRLPGKVLREILYQPMLVQVVERLSRAETVHQVVVATTTDASDAPLVALCQKQGYAYYCGSLNDVLDRFYQTARAYLADVVVRVTADCPLIDPAVVDLTVRSFLGQVQPPAQRTSLGALPPYDFASNRLPPPWQRTFPIGLDTEVVSFAALERAWQEAAQPHQREHVLPYLYDDIGLNFDQPSRFRVLVVDWEQDLGGHRWTVDTPQDLELAQRVFAAIGHNRFGWQEVLALLEKQPELAQINAAVPHNTAFDVDPRAVKKGKP